MSTRADFKFSETEHWQINLTARDSQGQIMDLTGAEVELMVASLAGTVLYEATSEESDSTIVITDADSGLVTIIIPPSVHQNADLVPGQYKHECLVTLASGVKTVQFQGLLIVENSLFV